MLNWLQRACAASGLSAHDVAQHLGQTDEYLETRMRYPGLLTINELFALSGLFNEESQQIMWEALDILKPR